MRDSREMIDKLKKMSEEYIYIQNLVQNDSEMFLAIRENYLNIYYMGASLAKIRFNKQKEVVFELHKKYIGIDEDGYARLSWKEHKEKLNIIKSNISKIALPIEDKKVGKTTREKICQQWIINSNNINDSEWYYIDMEYTMKNIPSGRFDMIAVKRKANKSGRYQVALVELKIGNDRYTSMDGTRYNDKEAQYKDVKENSLYAYQTKDTYLSFGSGLLGHLCDYMRFLNAKHYNTLKQEIVYQIDALKQLGIITNTDSVGEIVNESMLSDKPEIHFVSFSHVPPIIGDKVTDIEDMKESFYKYMYSTKIGNVGKNGRNIRCSQYAAQEMLNSNEINGLLEMEPFFLCTETPAFELEIGEMKYRFICNFVDASKECAWDCLYE